MIFVAIWAVCWLVAATPVVTFDPLNTWAVGLIVAVVLGIFKLAARR